MGEYAGIVDISAFMDVSEIMEISELSEISEDTEVRDIAKFKGNASICGMRRHRSVSAERQEPWETAVPPRTTAARQASYNRLRFIDDGYCVTISTVDRISP